MGPIPWFIIPEYFNDDVRSTATMIVVASNWIFSFIIIFVWPYMNDGLGMFGSLIFFLCISICAIIFSVFCIHEPSREPKPEIKDDYKTEEKDDDEYAPGAL